MNILTFLEYVVAFPFVLVIGILIFVLFIVLLPLWLAAGFLSIVSLNMTKHVTKKRKK